ncbi:His/Gly/Thr/Pro-type tRNA ligase C-terminal domain-containing protein [Paenibacillus sp. N3.4]|uniref:His/Gly/Thr/Pro-type tRNA ligase C-terminal domain-containing protein n=1 Tax=Paenibacillus sp. N3.4 TaxID=2603222 RepID=UPI0011C8B860|nr:His/Gly/Thr/Pro-type tRNA ligase C-terminal domain-containing protein [Paenibacillus sp. N3.4]TXK85455.1 hypothetical protein FU659_04210 [Paenibacillus sp. N3.4]
MYINREKNEEYGVMVIPLDNGAIEEASIGVQQLQMAGIPSRMMNEQLAGSILTASALELGFRFLILIGKDEVSMSKVTFKDLFEQSELLIPLDKAIYLIEKIYPPENFT